ncbi:11504_t:CDS:2, partial [Scutellospora calospora]
FVFAMSNKPQSSNWVYKISMACFAIIMGYTLFAGSWLTINGFIYEIIPSFKLSGIQAIFYHSNLWAIVLPLASTYIMYIFTSLIMLDFVHMILCIVQHVFLIPFYVNVLNIYAFCNVHDISWGTKDANEVDLVDILNEIVISDEKNPKVSFSGQKNTNKDEDKGINHAKMIEESRKVFRACFVLLWLFSNALLVFCVISYVGTTLETHFSQTSRTVIYIAIILWSVTALSALRFFDINVINKLATMNEYQHCVLSSSTISSIRDFKIVQ